MISEESLRNTSSQKGKKPSFFLCIRNQNKKIQLNFCELKTKWNITTKHNCLTDFWAPTESVLFPRARKTNAEDKSKDTYRL